MYSVVEISGHQYSVKLGDKVDVEKLVAVPGQELEFERVLFLGGDKAQVGTPTVAKARVRAKVLRQSKGKKLLGAKRSPGLYFKRKNHRQFYTSLLITELTDESGKSERYQEKEPAPAKTEEKAEPKGGEDGA